MNSNRIPERSIGVKTATIVGINAMIGGGIFCVPLALSQSAGPAGVLTYLFVVVAVWLMAVSIARVAQLYPEEGSFYTYTKQWGGHYLGVAAAMSYIIGLTLGMGLIAKLAGLYLGENIIHTPAPLLSLIIIILLTILNVFGIAISQLGQIILVACTVTPILLTSLVCLLHAKLSNLFPFFPFGYSNIFASTKTVIFSFFGFECATSLFNIVKNPGKNVYNALAYSIAIVGIIYLIFTTSIMLAIPAYKFQNESSTLSQILAENLPQYWWISKVVNFSVLTAMLGTLHSLIWSSSMLLTALIKKTRFAILQNKNLVILVGIITAINSILLKSTVLFFELTAVFIVLPYISSMLTIIIKHKNQDRFYVYTAISGILTGLVIFVYAFWGIIWQIKNYLLA